MKQCVRLTSTGKLAILEKLYGCGGSIDRYVARAYEPAQDRGTYLSCITYKNELYGDIAQRAKDTKRETETAHKEVYSLTDQLFPELNGKGIKSEGFVQFRLSDVETSQIQFE